MAEPRHRSARSKGPKQDNSKKPSKQKQKLSVNPTKEELRASHFGRSSLHPQGHEFEKPLQREGKATQPDDRWLDSKDRHERYTIQENQKKKEAFFCGVPDEQIPDNILDTVLTKVAVKLYDHKSFNVTAQFARMLEVRKVIVYECLELLVNPHIRRAQKVHELINGLQQAGRQLNTLVTFHDCLIESSQDSWTAPGQCPNHRELADQIQLHALVECRVNKPILGDVSITGADLQETLRHMISTVAQLIDPISEEDCLEICRHLGIPEEALTLEKHGTIGAICGQWLVKKNVRDCTPARFMEALLLTKGLGQYLSNLCYPHNPPEVAAFMMRLGESDFEKIPQFLGYTEKDLQHTSLPFERKVDRFLNSWKMPCTGNKQTNINLLKKLAHVAGSQRVCAGEAQLIAVYENESLKSKRTLPDDATTIITTTTHTTTTATTDSTGSAVAVKTMTSSQEQIKTGDQSQESQSEHLLTVHQEPVPSESRELQLQESACSQSVSDYTEHLIPGEALIVSPRCPREEISLCDLQRSSNDVLLNSCTNPSNIKLIIALLESGKQQNVVRESDGAHAIHIAVESGSEEIAQSLLDHGARLDCTNDRGQTPLMVACIKKNIRLVKFLAETGADPNMQSHINGYGCLHFKETLESLETVRYLVEEGGANVNLATYDGLTPLTRCCVINGSNLETLNYLLKKCANPNGVENAQLRPLCAAAAAGHDNYVISLLKKRADVNIRNRDGCTPLLKACQHLRFKIVSELLKYEADVKCVSKDGTSPVMAAVENNSKELLEILLHEPHRPELCIVKTLGEQNDSMLPYRGRGVGRIFPLGLAAARSRLDIVQKLVQAGADINLLPDGSLSPLAFAVLGSSTCVVEYLLNHPDLRKGIHDISPALVVSVQVGNIPMANLLMNLFGGKEKTLMEATDCGDVQLANNLLNFQEMTKCSEGCGPCLPPGAEEVRSKPLMPVTTISQPNPVTTSTLPTWNSPPNYVHEYGAIGSGVAILNEFAQFSIQSVSRDEHGQTLLIQTAIAWGYDGVGSFFKQYFMNPALIENLFGEFIQCDMEKQHPSPAQFLFNSGGFSAEEFERVLTNYGKRDFLVQVEMALLAYPAAEAIGCQTGADIIRHLFGVRFYQAVLQQGLPLMENQNHAPRWKSNGAGVQSELMPSKLPASLCQSPSSTTTTMCLTSTTTPTSSPQHNVRQPPSTIDFPKVQRNPKDCLLYRAYKQILASYILTNTLWYKAHVQALCAEQSLAVSNSERPYEGNSGRRERVQKSEQVRCVIPKTGASERPHEPIIKMKANPLPSNHSRKVMPVSKTSTDHPQPCHKESSKLTPSEHLVSSRQNVVKDSPRAHQPQEDLVHTSETRKVTLEHPRPAITSGLSHVQTTSESPPVVDPTRHQKVFDKRSPRHDPLRKSVSSTLSLQDTQHVIESSISHNSVDSSEGNTTAASSHPHEPQLPPEVCSMVHQRSPSPTSSTASTSSSSKQSARVRPLARQANPTSHTSTTPQTNPSAASKYPPQEVVNYAVDLPSELDDLRMDCSEGGLAVEEGFTHLLAIVTLPLGKKETLEFKLPNKLRLLRSHAKTVWEKKRQKKLQMELIYRCSNHPSPLS